MNELVPDRWEPVVIVEDPSFLIVDKPAGLPTVPLKQDPPDKPSLLGLMGKEYPEILTVQDQKPWEGGAAHRLDTATSGLVVIARDYEAWRILKASQQAGLYLKDYKACSAGVDLKKPPLEGFPPYPYDDPTLDREKLVRIGCLFRPWGEGRRTVRPVCKDAPPAIVKKASPNWYMTEVSYQGDRTEEGLLCREFSCRIHAGFRHQIRCHLAWSGWPILGDDLYGGLPASHLYLRSYGVRFPHPSDSHIVEIQID